jgi:hypothetical protein
MALTRVDLQIENTVSDTCTDITLADTTGEFPVSADGYGAPNVIIHDDVLLLVIVVRNETTGLYFTYTLVVALQVIQSGTLSVQGGTAEDITSYVSASAFPFITGVNEFSLFEDRGVTLPSMVDGAYQVEYTISGSSTQGGGEAEDFSYTTSETFVVDCETKCCITKMLADIDPDCSCSDKKQDYAMRAYTWLLTAKAAAGYGQVDKAVEALAKAKSMCDCGCGC